MQDILEIIPLTKIVDEKGWINFYRDRNSILRLPKYGSHNIQFDIGKCRFLIVLWNKDKNIIQEAIWDNQFIFRREAYVLTLKKEMRKNLIAEFENAEQILQKILQKLPTPFKQRMELLLNYYQNPLTSLQKNQIAIEAIICDCAYQFWELNVTWLKKENCFTPHNDDLVAKVLRTAKRLYPQVVIENDVCEIAKCVCHLLKHYHIDFMRSKVIPSIRQRVEGLDEKILRKQYLEKSIKTCETLREEFRIAGFTPTESDIHNYTPS